MFKESVSSSADEHAAYILQKNLIRKCLREILHVPFQTHSKHSPMIVMFFMLLQH